jgi:hypothetical protein
VKIEKLSENEELKEAGFQLEIAIWNCFKNPPTINPIIDSSSTETVSQNRQKLIAI